MARQSPQAVQRFFDRFSRSRDFSISLSIHLAVVLLFGSTVLFQVVKPPPEFTSNSPSFVQDPVANIKQPPPHDPVTPQMDVTKAPNSPSPDAVNVITTLAPRELVLTPSQIVAPLSPAPIAPQDFAPPARDNPDQMPYVVAQQIGIFTKDWQQGSTSGPLKEREFKFTAYIGQYQGGNWNSTITTTDGEMSKGSLPNLLYYMSFWSKDKIKTNYQSVQAIRLDSDDLFAIKPPFIFLTGTQDFVLTPKEVENLAKYVRNGGCIWGDSSVPGSRSRFDLAFRREMRRVIPDVDKNFEALPANHPIFSQTYFQDVKEVPAGLNFYRLPVYALKIYGEVAIIYTANDYGDMWQVSLNEKKQIDLRRNARLQYVGINEKIYDQRDIYIRNIEASALDRSYKFGTNIVVHLLTRWENKVRNAPTL